MKKFLAALCLLLPVIMGCHTPQISAGVNAAIAQRGNYNPCPPGYVPVQRPLAPQAPQQTKAQSQDRVVQVPVKMEPGPQGKEGPTGPKGDPGETGPAAQVDYAKLATNVINQLTPVIKELVRQQVANASKDGASCPTPQELERMVDAAAADWFAHNKDAIAGRDGTIDVIVRRLDGSTEKFERLSGGTLEIDVTKELVQEKE